MLLITYYATCPETHEQLDGDTLFCHQTKRPAWFSKLGEPDHTMPLDIWTSLQGDSQNVIHVTGDVRYWHGDRDMVAALVTPEHREVFESIGSKHPTAQYVVRAEQRDTRAVSRHDREFQAELQKAMQDDDDDDARVD